MLPINSAESKVRGETVLWIEKPLLSLNLDIFQVKIPERTRKEALLEDHQLNCELVPCNQKLFTPSSVLEMYIPPSLPH